MVKAYAKNADEKKKTEEKIVSSMAELDDNEAPSLSQGIPQLFSGGVRASTADNVALDSGLRAEMARVWNLTVQHLGQQAAGVMVMEIAAHIDPASANRISQLLTLHRLDAIRRSGRDWRSAIRSAVTGVLVPALPLLVGEHTRAWVSETLNDTAQAWLQDLSDARERGQEWASTMPALICMAVLGAEFMRRTLTPSAQTVATEAPVTRAGQWAGWTISTASRAWTWFKGISTMLANTSSHGAHPAHEGAGGIVTSEQPAQTAHLSVAHVDDDGTAQFHIAEGNYLASHSLNATMDVAYRQEHIDGGGYLVSGVHDPQSTQSTRGAFEERLSGVFEPLASTALAGIRRRPAPGVAVGDQVSPSSGQHEMPVCNSRDFGFFQAIRAQQADAGLPIRGIHIEIALPVADNEHDGLQYPIRLHAFTLNAQGQREFQQTWEHTIPESHKAALLKAAPLSQAERNNDLHALSPEVSELLHPATAFFNEQAPRQRPAVLQDIIDFANHSGPTTVPVIAPEPPAGRHDAPPAASTAHGLRPAGVLVEMVAIVGATMTTMGGIIYAIKSLFVDEPRHVDPVIGATSPVAWDAQPEEEMLGDAPYPEAQVDESAEESVEMQSSSSIISVSMGGVQLRFPQEDVIADMSDIRNKRKRVEVLAATSGHAILLFSKGKEEGTHMEIDGNESAIADIVTLIRQQTEYTSTREYPPATQYPPGVDYARAVAQCEMKRGCWAVRYSGGTFTPISGSRISLSAGEMIIPVFAPFLGAQIVFGIPDDARLAKDSCGLDMTLLFDAGYGIQHIEHSRLEIWGRDMSFSIEFIAGESAPAGSAVIAQLMSSISAQRRRYREEEWRNKAVEWNPPPLAILSNSSADAALFKMADVSAHTASDHLLAIDSTSFVGDPISRQLAELHRKRAQHEIEFAANLPDIVKEARKYMEALFIRNFNLTIDASTTYLHEFTKPMRFSAQEDGGYQHHNSSLVRTIPLDQLPSRFIPFEYLSPPYRSRHPEQIVGFYNETGVIHYSSRNRLHHPDGRQITVDDVYNAMKKDPFETQATNLVEEFWRVNSIAYATEQRKIYAEFLLLEADTMDQKTFELAYAVLAEDRDEDDSLRIETMDVYSYPIGGVLLISRATGGPVLIYKTPLATSKTPAFISCKDMNEVKWKIITSTYDEGDRAELLSRFGAGDQQDGPTMFGTSGVDTVLTELNNIYNPALDKGDRPSNYIHPDMWGPQHINQRLASTRSVSGDPFAKLAELMQKNMLSDIKVLVISSDEYIAQQLSMWMEGLTTATALASLPFIPVMPWKAVAVLAAVTGTPAVAAGLNQVMVSDTHEGKLQGWTLAISGGLDLGFAAPASKLGALIKAIPAKVKAPAKLVAKFGQTKIEKLGRAIGIELFPTVPRIGALPGRYSNEAVSHLITIPRRLQEEETILGTKASKVLANFKAKISVVERTNALGDAGKTVKFKNIAKQTQAMLDDIYQNDLLRIVPSDDLMSANMDAATRATVTQYVERQNMRFKSLADEADVSTRELLDEKIVLQREMNTFIEDSVYSAAEWSGPAKRQALKDYSAPTIVKPGHAPAVDGTYMIGDKRYVFVEIDGDELAVSISMIRPGTKECVLQTTSGTIAIAADAPTVVRMKNGSWRIVEKPRLLGGAPAQNSGVSVLAHVIRQADTSRLRGKSPYSIEVDGKSIKVGFDLEQYRWRELASGEYPTERLFGFDHALGQWRAVPAGSQGLRVTPTLKERALRDFGLSANIPKIPTYPGGIWRRKKIPNNIHQVWLGGEIPTAFMNNLDNMLEKLNRPGIKEPFVVNVHVDISVPAALEKTRESFRLLEEKYPGGVKLIELKNTDFFQEFAASKYHEQYQAALSEQAYAEAVDVLRYRLLDHHGGIYKDMDDELQNSLGDLQLKTEKGMILTMDLFSNPALKMEAEYNTSLFAAHKDNKTLQKISEESYARYQRNPDVYKNKPTDPAELPEHMEKVSKVGGPHLFSEIVSQEIPALGALRDWGKIRAKKIQISTGQQNKLNKAENAFFVLRDYFHVKSAQSWKPVMKVERWVADNGRAFVSDPAMVMLPEPDDFRMAATKARRGGITYAYQGKNYIVVKDTGIVEVDYFPDGIYLMPNGQKGTRLTPLFRTAEGNWESIPDVPIQRGGSSYDADGAYLLQKMINDRNYAIDQAGAQSLSDSPDFRLSVVEQIMAKKFDVPYLVYRCDPRSSTEVLAEGLTRMSSAEGVATSADDLLVYAIEHTALLRGSEKKMLSFSTSQDIPRQIKKQYPQNMIYEVGTGADRENWRTTADIILRDGMRLVESGRISTQMLYKAADNLKNSVENELFYLGNNGHVPKEAIIEAME